MTSPFDAWESFFQSCDLPQGVCKTYAQRFVKERMQPYMLKEIGKDEYKELGICALGDQLAISRYMKLCGGNPPAFKEIGRGKTSSDEEDEAMEVQTPAKLAPDRDEIYHIRMPAGKTNKTRDILQKQSILRDKGVIKRGVTGVRVSGIEVSNFPSSLSRISNTSKVIRKQTKAVMIQDISSSSALPRNAGSMRSDLISARTTVVALTPTSNRPKLLTTTAMRRIGNISPRVPQQTASASSSSPDFRVRLNIDPVGQPINARVERLVTGTQMGVARNPVVTRIERMAGSQLNAGPQVRKTMAQRVQARVPQAAPRVIGLPVGRQPSSIRRAPVVVQQKRSNIMSRISLNR